MDIAVSIIGAGHCGCAFAADLLSRGARVLLYSHPDHSQHLRAIHDSGGLRAALKTEGRFKPALSTAIEDAIRFSRYLVITVPAYGHDGLISELARFDLRAHVIVCITGNFFSLAARRTLDAAVLLETSSAPYASRVDGATVRIMDVKARMPIASLAPIGDEALRQGVSSLFPMPLDWRGNVLEIGLSCITGVIHPTPAVMNAGWIESTQGDFYFYRQGMTVSVARVMERIDRERLLIAEELGFSLPSTVEVMNSYYNGCFTDLAEFARHSSAHNLTKMAPRNLNHRFIAQDVPYVLVPWYELGRKAGIEARTIRAIIHVASLVHNVNYMESGRTLRKLGLHLLSKEDILDSVGASTGRVELPFLHVSPEATQDCGAQ